MKAENIKIELSRFVDDAETWYMSNVESFTITVNAGEYTQSRVFHLDDKPRGSFDRTKI